MLLAWAHPTTLDAATISAAWSSLDPVFGVTDPDNNEDRTISWSVGGARTVTQDFAGAGVINYRIDSGSWTAYSGGGFSLSSGQTVAWQMDGNSNESGTISVYVNGTLLTSFSYNATGFP